MSGGFAYGIPEEISEWISRGTFWGISERISKTTNGGIAEAIHASFLYRILFWISKVIPCGLSKPTPEENFQMNP